jgi:putative addiction module component (TIGR02574 family)
VAELTNAAQQVYEQALGLSDEEREQLIEDLARSLKPVALSPAWRAEIGRRLETIERGEAVIHPDARDAVRRLRDK